MSKTEVKLSCVHTEIANRGSRGTAPLMLNLGTMCRRVVTFTPQLLLPPKKESMYPLIGTFGKPQSQLRRKERILVIRNVHNFQYLSYYIKTCQ